MDNAIFNILRAAATFTMTLHAAATFAMTLRAAAVAQNVCGGGESACFHIFDAPCDCGVK